MCTMGIRCLTLCIRSLCNSWLYPSCSMQILYCSTLHICCVTHTQMYVMLDALADGGVYAGVPKEIALKLAAHTMMVRHGLMGQ